MFPTDDDEYKLKRIPHYYGDVVRIIFVIAGLTMLIFLPIFKDLVVVPISSVILVIICIDLFAGLTNPLQKWISLVNLIISLSAFIIFESIAVDYFSTSEKLYASVNQFLALLFFLSLYFSTKTFRGFLVKDR